MPLGLMRFDIDWTYRPRTLFTGDSLLASFNATSPLHKAGKESLCSAADNHVSAIAVSGDGGADHDVYFGGAASCYGSVGKISVPTAVSGAVVPQPVATLPPGAPLRGYPTEVTAGQD